MSKQSNETPVTPINPDVVEGVVVETPEKQSFVTKTKTFLQTHKKLAIAGGALVGLVAVSAVAGRKTAPEVETPTFDTFEPMEIEVSETDDTVAQES